MTINRRALLGTALAAIASGVARFGADGNQSSSSSLATTVGNTERAFADSMARRDFNAFASHLSLEAIFFAGSDGHTASKGRDAILAAWKRFFEGPTAPFSWTPDLVEVLASGTLALTSGAAGAWSSTAVVPPHAAPDRCCC
jgi:ketosteroid isomerase-like protein